MGNWPLAILLIGITGINVGINGADLSRLAATLMLLIPVTLVTYLLIVHELQRLRTTRKGAIDRTVPGHTREDDYSALQSDAFHR